MTLTSMYLTEPEVAEAIRTRPLAVVPTGSVEQHGPHLPTGTDHFAALSVAERVVGLLGGILVPFSPVGVTPMHMPFASTISFSAETFERMLTEVGGCLARHGIEQLLIVNWHEGNIPAIAIAAENLQRTEGLSVVIAQACYVAEELFGPECGGLTHGGEIEARAVLASVPDHVHLDRAAGASDPVRGARVDSLRRTRAYQPVLSDVRVIAPSGWYGDPGGATVENGEELVSAVSTAIAKSAGEILGELARLRDEAEQGRPAGRTAAGGA